MTLNLQPGAFITPAQTLPGILTVEERPCDRREGTQREGDIDGKKERRSIDAWPMVARKTQRELNPGMFFKEPQIDTEREIVVWTCH